MKSLYDGWDEKLLDVGSRSKNDIENNSFKIFFTSVQVVLVAMVSGIIISLFLRINISPVAI